MAIINKKQFKAVLAYQAILIGFCLFVGIGFWGSLCHFTFDQCIDVQSPWSPFTFLLLAILRPIFFTPTLILATIAGKSFPFYAAVFLTAFGAALSSMLVYFPGRLLGVSGVRPWLASNLPATWHLIKAHDYKIVFFLRWLTVFPFDLCSLLFGIFSFRPFRAFLATFIGVMPEAYIFAHLASTDSERGIFEALLSLLVFGCVTITPLVVYEFAFRKRGRSLWTMLRSTYYEVIYEIKSNNEIIKRRDYDPNKPIVILLYGFFSSRKSLTIMERLLNQRGLQVMTFNLGGLLGVFFTRGIRETAEYIDEKIRRQIDRHNLKKFYLIGHSKGGLVGLWWVLKLGGHRYCTKIITMGSPFAGSYLTYFGLFSPLGFIWHDLWQMRPKSQFLKDLHEAEIPDSLQIYCMYSEKDRVVGLKGLFEPRQPSGRVQAVPMHRVAHFEFLYKRDVADMAARILRQHIDPATEEKTEKSPEREAQ